MELFKYTVFLTGHNTETVFSFFQNKKASMGAAVTYSHEVMKVARHVQVTAAFEGVHRVGWSSGEIGAVSVQWGQWK